MGKNNDTYEEWISDLKDEVNYPRLDDEEIKELIYKAKKGDDKAKKRILASYNCVKMMKFCAWKYSDSIGETPDDLLGWACIYLIDIINEFDPERGIKLTTYAQKVIEHEFNKKYRESKHLTKVEQKTIQQVEKAMQEYRNIHIKEPTNQELADFMGIEVEKLKGMRIIAERASKYSDSYEDLEELEEMGEGSLALSDIGASGSSYDMSSVEKKAVDNEFKNDDAIKNWLDDLTTLNFDTYVDNTTRSLNAREIIENLFGLSGKEKMEPQDLAEELKISEQRLNSIVKEILFEAKENGALKNLSDLIN